MGNIQAIGIGPPRTGTTTLKAALKILGFTPGHEHDPDTTCLVGDALCLPHDRYKTLHTRYPNAKFIYTYRETPNKWLQSVIKRTEVIKHNKGVLDQRRRMYGSSTVDPSLYLTYYYNRMSSVMNYFKESYTDISSHLIFLCWEMGDGWNELCQFLDVSVPHVQFPHKNKSK